MLGTPTALDFDHYRFERFWDTGPISGVPWPADGSRIQAEYFDIKGFIDADDNSLDGFHYRSDTDPFGNAPGIWHFWDDFVIGGLDLRGGGQLRIVFLDSGVNLDRIEVGGP